MHSARVNDLVCVYGEESRQRLDWCHGHRDGGGLFYALLAKARTEDGFKARKVREAVYGEVLGGMDHNHSDHFKCDRKGA